MTIDERLDRLTERHEALAQSLELLVASTRDLRESVMSHEHYITTLMSARPPSCWRLPRITSVA